MNFPNFTQLKLRRDAAANWTAADPILGSGEPGYETDTGAMKIGDGVTSWNTLAYFSADATADPVGSAAQAQANAEAYAAAQATAAQVAAQAASEQGLVATSVKTSSYTASPGDEVLVDVSAANVTISLPSAPADKSRVGIKVVAASAGTYSASLITQGADTYNKVGGASALTFSALNQGSIAKYQTSTKIWTVTATDPALGGALGAAKTGSDGYVGTPGKGGTQLSPSVVNARSGSASSLTEYVYTASGSDDKAAIAAALTTMASNSASGKLAGKLILDGTLQPIQLHSSLLINGGYTTVGNTPTGGAGEKFHLEVIGGIALSAGATITVEGLYAPTIDLRLYGGGARRKVTDAAISSSSNTTTLTSATAAFTSTDVGRYVRVEGASTEGEAPLMARISSVTNGTTVIVDTPATHTVSGATCVIGDVGLYLTDVINYSARLYGSAYQGCGLWIDDQASYGNAVREGTLHLMTQACGQGAFIRANEGDFGQIEHWYDSSIDGSVLAVSSDVTLTYFENYSPNTQTVGLLFDECFGVHGGKIALGGSPTEALMKMVGGGNSGGGNVGLWDEIYLTPSNSADGLKLVDCKTGTIDKLHSVACTKALHVKGADVRVTSFWSEGSDVCPLYIEAGTINSTCNVDVTFDADYVLGSAAIIASSVTGGSIKIDGKVRSWNQNSSVNYMIDCQASAVVLDLRGLRDLDQAASAYSVTQTFGQSGNLIVTDADRTNLKLPDYPNTLANAQPSGQVASPASGTWYPNNTHRTLELQVQVAMFGDGSTPGEFQFLLENAGAASSQIGQAYSGGVASQTTQVTQTLRVPPGWSWKYVNVNSGKGSLQNVYWRYC